MKFRSVCVSAGLVVTLASADAAACCRPFGFFAGRRVNAVAFVPATPTPAAVPAPMPAKPTPTAPPPASWSGGPVVVTGNRSIVQIAPTAGAACANGTCAPAAVQTRRGLFGWR